jgi:cytochrome c oxidase assembly protein subunit 15
VVTGLVLATALQIRLHFRSHQLLTRISLISVVLLIVQFAMGLSAFMINLDEAGYTLPSRMQVVINTGHMVVGALLMATIFCQMVIVLRGVEVLKKTPIIGVSSASNDKAVSYEETIATA